MNKSSLKEMSEQVTAGDFRAIARAITLVENDLEGASSFLKELNIGNTPVIGITGPPGAGKSTLINGFIRLLLKAEKKIAVLAVDPTSPFNYGSLLGDRLRMSEHFNNENVFIRSVATRGSLGGLSEKIVEISDVLRSSNFDLIIVETVGVGQSEVEIAGLADTTIVVLVPESGDSIQAMKSGIMEIADIFVVNKSDREGAEATYNNLRKLVHEKESSWNTPVIKATASEGDGLTELYEKVMLHQNSSHFNEKKLFLMTEKIYQLIRSRRMKDLSRAQIRNGLMPEILSTDFNLYRFADQFES